MSKIMGHGVDLVECARIQELGDRYGQRFLSRIFTQSELDYSLPRARKWEHLAGRFAAKEAILKAIGTGWRGKIAWTDMEIANDDVGRPTVRLEGHTQTLARQLGITEILISITHTKDHAVASAIAVKD